MKKIIIMIFVILISLFFVPPYNELNHLAIIDKVGVNYHDAIYTIYLREVIPMKDNNGITYRYKVYDVTTSNLDTAKDLLQVKTKKKLYLKKVKTLISNINTDEIKEKLDIKPKTIYHTDDIKSEFQ